MFTDEQIRAVRAVGDFGYDIREFEIEEIIETASDQGLFTDRVAAWGPQGSGGVRLELRVSDEFSVVTPHDMSRSDFINPDPHGLKIENMRFLLEKAHEVFTELKEAVTRGNQSDWRHTKISDER